MNEISKSHVRTEFFKELGWALWLERRDKRLKLSKVAQKSKLPYGLIERMERGSCGDIYKFFRLCAHYQKKIKIILVDET